MLTSARTIEVVAQALKDHKVDTLILDPVRLSASTTYHLSRFKINIAS